MRAAPPLVRAGLLAGLLLAGCSLAGDVTPPAALATAQMSQPLVVATQPPQAALLTPPSGPANLTAGEAIYLGKCAGCHGPTGLGDGVLAAGLQFPPAPLGSAEFARQAAPSQWYSAVTLGDLDRFMPPFASLSDSERWAVSGFALSLSVPAEVVQQGEALYDAECAGCHGPDGPGLDLTVGRALVDRSAQELFHTMTEGAGAGMPAYADSLSEDQRWAVAAFLQRRDLTAGTSQPEPVLVEDPARPALGAIRGVIRNGTAGANVPSGLVVELHGYDGDEEVVTQTTLADGEGVFAFSDLEAVPGRLFFASLEYQGLSFQSEVGHLLSDQPSLELPMTIYEPSPDAGALIVERLHLILDFPAKGMVRVLQVWALSNPTDRIIADPQGALRIRVPEKAFNVQFEELGPGGRFIQTPTGYLNTAPVPPGTGAADLAFQFDLRYQDRLDYEQTVDHPVRAVVVLMVPGGVDLRGDGVQDMGVLDMGGIAMQTYSIGGLAPGETLSFRLAGGLGAGTGGLSLLIGGGTLAIALILAGLWWYRTPGRRALRQSPEPLETPPAAPQDALLLAIARLDDEFEAGAVQESEYRQRRAELMQQALRQARAQAE